MHHPDSAADARAKKMAHPAMLPRRGSSSGGGGGGPPGSVGGSSSGLEEYPPVLLLQSPPPPPPSPAAAASAGPPQSLTLLSQPPPAQPPLGQAGAQLKKKSGFQITSVTPAQISASLSSNNSIAEDTESYDDLDESHTEDFSSSEILDVSLSRATDLGEPERSSSEETLNNFHEVESPGAVSPNQPRLPQQPSALTNGSIYPSHGHHFPHHHPNGHHQPSAHSGAGGTPASPSFRKLTASGSCDSAGPGSAAPSIGTLAAATVSHFRSGAASAGGGSASGMAGGGFGGTSGRLHQGSKNLGNLASAGTGAALPGGSVPGNMSLPSGAGNGAGVSSNATGSAAVPAAAAPSGHLQPAASTSRFRVVKLDSSSEPFKKGRWTCTEFYDKENPGPATEAAAVGKVADVLEVASERETTSGSSVSSTLSHYTESVGSGEMGVPSGALPPAFPGSQQMDFGGAGSLPLPTAGLPQSVSQSQLSQVQFHPQDVSYSQQKQGVPPPASAVPPSVNMVGGHQPALTSQQLPFAPPTQPVLTLPVAPQPQPLPFGQGPAQHPSTLQPMPMQMASGHVKPVPQASAPGPALDYAQPPAPPQQILPAPAASLKSGPAGVGTGVAVPPAVPLSVQAHVAVVPPQPVAPAQPAIPAPVINVAPTVANPIASSVMGQVAAPLPSQAGPSGIVLPGSQGAPPSLPQPLSIAPQSTLIPGQPAEPPVQAMAGQQLPPVSPIPSVSAAPVLGLPAANGPPAPLSLAPSKNTAQPSGMLTVSQPPLVSGSLNLPAAPTVPLSSTQFSALSLAQSISACPEDAKRPTESTLGVLPHLPSVEGSLGPSSALSDGSVAASLFPLKVFPLTSQQLLDGEDDSSSGASVVAIDNKIEQAMDLVKSHLMYAVREEVEVLKEQIKELVEKNNQLEQENSLLKTLASPEQLAQFQAQLQTGSSQPQGTALQPPQPAPPGSGPSA